MSNEVWVPGTIHYNGKSHRVWVHGKAQSGGGGAIAQWHHVEDGHITVDAVLGAMSGETTSFGHVWSGRVSRFGQDIGALSEIFTPDSEVPA